MRTHARALVAAALLGAAAAAPRLPATPLAAGVPVRGWTILSDSRPDDLAVIAAAPAYGINHLELSDQLGMQLRQLRDPRRAALVNELIARAHAAGIREVVLWEHCLYDLDYYPARFRTGPNGTLDFDNPAFWDWLKADYRDLLDRASAADGVVLTFVDTGAHAEQQYSRRLATPAEKLAAVVNAVADVVVGERHLNLYARTLASSEADVATMYQAVACFRRPEVRLMMKETVEDFFLTSPREWHAGQVDRPTLIEFDPAGEMNGQGLVANTWPEYFLRRWRAFAALPNVIGYTARTDRYGSTRLIGRPGEIDLLALKMSADNPQTTAEDVYAAFIAGHYGAGALADVRAAFRNAWDIVTSGFYTLGNSTSNHSHLDPDPFAASYINYAAGKWMPIPILWVGHGVDREFHCWKDVIEHIAPAPAKDASNAPWAEVPWVLQRHWVRPGEAMNETYLRYIVEEKAFGVARAEESLAHIERARGVLRPRDYRQLRDYFECTLLTARLQAAFASAYYGFRVWCRGGAYRTDFVQRCVRRGLADLHAQAEAIRRYPDPPPIGQWNWAKDADLAETYAAWIERTGWPRDPGAEFKELQTVLPDDEAYPGFNPAVQNPNAGMTFH